MSEVSAAPVGENPASNDDALTVEHAADHQENEASNESKKVKYFAKFCDFFHAYEFPILILIAICLAKAYPPLGAEYLAPDITAKWIAVIIIFFFSGLSLSTRDFVKVIMRPRLLPFNAFVQIFNFLVVSAAVFGGAQVLKKTGLLHPAMIDGLIVCSCLPMSINVGIVLTAKAGGDEAAAVLHSAVGNSIGVFLAPSLILMYLPSFAAEVDFMKVILSLIYRVLVPLIIGQVVQKLCTPVYAFYIKHRPKFKKVPEVLLTFIVYTIFCESFHSDDEKASGVNIVVLLVSNLFFQATLSSIAWLCLSYIVPDEPGLRVMGTICSSHKTIALGFPLISSIVTKDTPNASFYFLPLLMWHPMQLVFGSLFTAKASRWIAAEEKRCETVVSSEFSRWFEVHEEKLHDAEHISPKHDVEANNNGDDESKSKPVEVHAQQKD